MILRFRRDALLYDIGNYAYIAGHRLEIEEHDTALAHLLIDICAEGNIDRVLRILACVYTSIKAKLQDLDCRGVARHHGAMVYDSTSDTIDNELWTPEEYEIELNDRTGFTFAKWQSLSCLIHEYMVCMVIADWLSIIYSVYAKTWTEKADTVLSEIDAVLRNAAPYRRRIDPL